LKNSFRIFKILQVFSKMYTCVICLDEHANYQLCYRCFVCKYHISCITNLINHNANVKCPTCRMQLQYYQYLPIIEQLPLYPELINMQINDRLPQHADLIIYISMVENYIAQDGNNLIDNYNQLDLLIPEQHQLLTIANQRKRIYNSYKIFSYVMYSLIIIFSMLTPVITLVLLDEINLKCNVTPIKYVTYACHITWLIHLALFFKFNIIYMIDLVVETFTSTLIIIISADICINYSIIALHAFKICLWFGYSILSKYRYKKYINDLARFQYNNYV